MRPSEDHDRVGLCPPGVGSNKVEPAKAFKRVSSISCEAAADVTEAIAAHVWPDVPRTITVESVLADLLSLSEDDQSRVRLEAYRLVTASRPPPNRSEMEAIRARDNWELQNALGNKTVSMAQMMVDAGDRRMQAIAAGLYGKVAPGT